MTNAPDSAGQPATPPTSEKITLIVVAAVQFLVPFLMSAVAVILPVLGRQMHASAVQLSLVQSSHVLAVAAFLLPVGRFSDIHGRKRLFIIGISILSVTTLALSLTRSMETFILFRFIQGIGSAMIFSNSMAILTSVFPQGRRGMAMGITLACVYIGMAAGPGMAGFITELFSWRWVFGSVLVLQVAVLFLTLAFLKGEWSSAQGEPFDWIGSGWFIVSMALLIGGATGCVRYESARWAALAGLAGMGFFALRQWRTAHPILDLHLLVENLPFTFSNMATFINYAATFSFIFLFSLYLQFVKGLPPSYAGLLLVTQPLVQAVLSPIAGRLSDVYPPAYIATIGMAICTVGLFWASSLDGAASLTLIVLVTAIIGVSLGLFSTPNMTAIMGCVEPKHVGIASSMVATMRSTGILSSATIIAIIFSFFLGNQEVNAGNIDAFLTSMQTALVLFSGLSLIGTIFSAVNKRLVSVMAGKPG